MTQNTKQYLVLQETYRIFEYLNSCSEPKGIIDITQATSIHKNINYIKPKLLFLIKLGLVRKHNSVSTKYSIV